MDSGHIIVLIFLSYVMIKNVNAEDNFLDRHPSLRNSTVYQNKTFEVRCDEIQFHNTTPIGYNLVYHSVDNVPMTWYEAVCCCRRKGLHLYGPTTEDAMLSFFNANKKFKDPGWIAAHALSGPVWKDLLTGSEVSKGLLYWPAKVPVFGNCLEMGQVPGTTVPYLVFDLELSCDWIYDQAVVCEKSTDISLKENCFDINSETGIQVCNKESIETYGRTGMCPEASRAVATSTTTTTEPPCCCPWWTKLFG